MHNGATIMNVIAFDYLVSQRVIPFVNEIIDAQVRFCDVERPFYFITRSGIDVIKEIMKIRFQYSDIENEIFRESVGSKLLNIGHLKELGRASYNDDYFLRANRFYHENHYENPDSRSERCACAEKDASQFSKVVRCPCCNLYTLVVYRDSHFDTLFERNSLHSWCKCFNCDYSVSDRADDPHSFGITKEPIFD
jgi:hypothetical protein